MKVAAFTGGRDIPAARFRVRQYVHELRRHGIELTEYPAPLLAYPPRQRWVRPVWAAATLLSRAPAVLRSHRCDVTLLQREMLSTYSTLERFTKGPRVLDVDDAIWLYAGGRAAVGLARCSAAVICGNTFLAEHFSRFHRNVTIVPTAVDTDRFIPAAPVEESVIGWSGTSGGFEYFRGGIERALAKVLKNVPRARLRIVSDARPAFSEIAQDRVEFIRWSPDNEVAAIQGMAVGIMPLPDAPWERGKCSYKMLTYMACGVPVVVSPVGMNADVLALGRSGFAASTEGEWVSLLSDLLADASERAARGADGRKVVDEHFALRVVAPRLAAALNGAVG